MSKFHIRNICVLFSINFLLLNCAMLGTITIEKSKDLQNIKLKKVGFCQTYLGDSLDKLIPNTSEYCKTAIKDFYLKDSLILNYHTELKLNSFDKVDSSIIVEICAKNNLDAFICSKIQFKFKKYYLSFIPLGLSQDVCVDIKLFNKFGKLLIHTRRATDDGNSYLLPPKIDRTVHDGVFGALEQVSKEIMK